MRKQMKLRGTVTLEDDRSLTFRGNLFDETPFDLIVDKHDVHTNDDFRPTKRTVMGWMYVVQESKQGSRCALTLPKPTLQYGRQVTVRELDLMPRDVSIEDFIRPVIGKKQAAVIKKPVAAK
ncbi:unnamed protein product [marine sediment metagenome]|uniref:Uncharacterized protein n=1 Tax=marine sediment metagenome TaxID=412755 RepID=X0XGL7_9ZZZZ